MVWRGGEGGGGPNRYQRLTPICVPQTMSDANILVLARDLLPRLLSQASLSAQLSEGKAKRVQTTCEDTRKLYNKNNVDDIAREATKGIQVFNKKSLELDP